MGKLQTQQLRSDAQLNGSFDIVKFLSSLVIMAIHCPVRQELVFPWSRVIVPLYFVMTGYFLFSKLRGVPEQDQPGIIKKFVIRNFKLYFFWLVLLLVPTLLIRDYFREGIAEGVIRIIREFLFDSSFPSSWYIMATIMGVPLIWWLTKKWDSKYVFLFSQIVYFMVALDGTYGFVLAPWSETFAAIKEVTSQVIPELQYSFLHGIHYLVIGRCFALEEIRIKRTTAWLMVIPAMVLMYAECWLVYSQINLISCGQYICLPFVCVILFSAIKEFRLPVNKWTILLRKCSVVIYAMHYSLIQCVLMVTYVRPRDMAILTTAACLAFSALVFWLEKKRGFRWLRYAY